MRIAISCASTTTNLPTRIYKVLLNQHRDRQERKRGREGKKDRRREKEGQNERKKKRVRNKKDKEAERGRGCRTYKERAGEGGAEQRVTPSYPYRQFCCVCTLSASSARSPGEPLVCKRHGDYYATSRLCFLGRQVGFALFSIRRELQYNPIPLSHPFFLFFFFFFLSFLPPTPSGHDLVFSMIPPFFTSCILYFSSTLNLYFIYL